MGQWQGIEGCDCCGGIVCAFRIDGSETVRLCNTDDLLDFVTAYVTCALWSSTDNSDDSGGDPLDDNYGTDDIEPATFAAMVADCEAFMQANKRDLRGMNIEQAGHDFWLTRNGHGAGFWDRGLGVKGDRLTKASKVYGSCDLYVGDNGKIGA